MNKRDAYNQDHDLLESSLGCELINKLYESDREDKRTLPVQLRSLNIAESIGLWTAEQQNVRSNELIIL